MKRHLYSLMLACLLINASCTKSQNQSQAPAVPKRFELEVLGSVTAQRDSTINPGEQTDETSTNEQTEETGQSAGSTTENSTNETDEEQAAAQRDNSEGSGEASPQGVASTEEDATSQAGSQSILVRYQESALNGQDLPGEALNAVPGLRKVVVPAGETMEAALQRYQADPNVLYAEPDMMVHGQEFPSNDPFLNEQVYLFDFPTFSRVTPVWEQRTDACNQVVAVIDSGLDMAHVDISRNIWTNPNEILNGIDDDGNGYIDDLHGYDFFQNDPNPEDENGHGTFVSGIIGAVGNNGLGIAGVTWCVKIMPLKVFGPDGTGTLSGIIQAIDYAVAKGARLSNNSYGTFGFSFSFRDAVERARNAGHLFVTSAGNDNRNIDIDPQYPASFTLDNIVTVGATNGIGVRAEFSNFGPRSVDLFAQGTNILSLFPGNFLATGSGTSFSAPLVTGVAALLMEDRPELTYQDVRGLLINSGRPSPSLKGLSQSDAILSASAAFYPKIKLATGAGATGGPHVKAFDKDGNEIISRFAYTEDFIGGVRVAVGDLNADGLPDIVTAAGPGGGSHIRVIDGRTGAINVGFFAYPDFFGGVYVASGDVTGDGYEDIITAADAGGGPHIKVYRARDMALIHSFTADYIGTRGVRVSVGDFDGDDRADIVVAPGPGAGPAEVRIYNGSTLSLMHVRTPYPGFQGGIFVAAGDFDGDRRAELVTGADAGGSPHVRVENLMNGVLYYNNFPFDFGFGGGVRVGAGDYNGDGRADLFTAAGPGGGPHVRVIDVVNSQVPFDDFPYSELFGGGVFGGL